MSTKPMQSAALTITVRHRSPARRKAKHIPPAGTKRYLLLKVLLSGDIVDPIYAIAELNLPTVGARVSELRKLGWPVQTTELPHPKLKNEKMMGFYFDGHFRRWIVENPAKAPAEYPFNEGRGRFSRENVAKKPRK